MSTVEMKLHRLSPNQLRALFLLAKSKHGIISSSLSGEKIGKHGKALGGIFSSLARQHIGQDPLVMPWGKSETGRGLMWKLNTKLVSQKDLYKYVRELIEE